MPHQLQQNKRWSTQPKGTHRVRDTQRTIHCDAGLIISDHVQLHTFRHLGVPMRSVVTRCIRGPVLQAYFCLSACDLHPLQQWSETITMLWDYQVADVTTMEGLRIASKQRLCKAIGILLCEDDAWYVKGVQAQRYSKHYSR